MYQYRGPLLWAFDLWGGYDEGSLSYLFAFFDSAWQDEGVSVIEVRNLHKTYGLLEAVDGIDLSIEQGEIFAILGPNGAGKTTTVEILEGFRTRNSGEVKVLDFDPRSKARTPADFVIE